MAALVALVASKERATEKASVSKRAALKAALLAACPAETVTALATAHLRTVMSGALEGPLVRTATALLKLAELQ